MFDQHIFLMNLEKNKIRSFTADFYTSAYLKQAYNLMYMPL